MCLPSPEKGLSVVGAPVPRPLRPRHCLLREQRSESASASCVGERGREHRSVHPPSSNPALTAAVQPTPLVDATLTLDQECGPWCSDRPQLPAVCPVLCVSPTHHHLTRRRREGDPRNSGVRGDQGAVSVSSRPKWWGAGRAFCGSYLVDPASSHMLVSKIKPCMSQYIPH
jgi:hypothetical protein